MPATKAARYHAETPDVTVLSGAAGAMVTLRLLRSPQDGADIPAAKLLRNRIHADALTRTVRQFGARALQVSAGTTTLADATTVASLGGRQLKLHTTDGDTSLSLDDATGRPLWTCNAQGTHHTHTYETPDQGGRKSAVFEQPAAGIARMRERLVYAPATAADRQRNLAGATLKHFDNAGLTHTALLSLTSKPLETRQQLLQPHAEQPDWAGSSEGDLEENILITVNRYNAVGDVLVRTNAAGVTSSKTLDVSGAVRQIHLRQGAKEAMALAAVTRRADGMVTAQTSGNGVVDLYGYSPTSQRLIQHRTQRPIDHALGYLLISDLHYGYDPAGNILALDDQGADPQWHDNQQSDGLREYAYDTLYRLVEASGRERSPVGAYWSSSFGTSDRKGGMVWTPYSERYEYDDGDNLITLSHNGGAGKRTQHLCVSTQSNRAMPEGQGLTPDNGFLPGGLQKQLVDGRALAWLADHQLAQVSLIKRANGAADDIEQYRYANGGTRRRKISTVRMANAIQTTLTTYIDDCEVRLRTLEGQPQALKQVVISEVEQVRWIENRLSTEVHLRYGFSDHLGSSAGETDEAGNIVSREEYSPYGETVGLDEQAAEVDGLTQRTSRQAGKELDASGLYYYGWRYYQTGLGRWLSADPGGLVDGPNLYRMNRNNPLRFRDAMGMSPEDDPSNPNITIDVIKIIAAALTLFLSYTPLGYQVAANWVKGIPVVATLLQHLRSFDGLTLAGVNISRVATIALVSELLYYDYHGIDDSRTTWLRETTNISSTVSVLAPLVRTHIKDHLKGINDLREG
ncbi:MULTISPECIES: RHS repeat-associated core domain-containing protein, partial [unclassified Pseudomonas]|uniref:RHS repeat-associated core domain-containing protein n=1 Tax=unclassified Pseudomonas TaxID=196821 RepID=UPI0006D42F47